MSITAAKLIALLSRASPDAEIRFWIDPEEEAEFDVAYDNEGGDNDTEKDPDLWIGIGADVVNIDLTPLEELGGGSDDQSFDDDRIPPWGIDYELGD